MPLTHNVESGECVEVIAFKYGFYPDTLWDLEENWPLREKRGSMNRLVEGDVVEVPDVELKLEDAATEVRHRFRRKGVPSRFRVRFADEADQPLANVAYQTIIDNVFGPSGRTDAEGVVDIPVSPIAARLVLKLETAIEWAKESEFFLSSLQPIDTIAGVKARLASLGYYGGTIDAVDSSSFRDGAKRFIAGEGLDVSEDPTTSEFQDALRAVYGC